MDDFPDDNCFKPEELKKCYYQYEITHKNFNCFKIGEEVFHKSNIKIKMRIHSFDCFNNKIICSWKKEKNVINLHAFIPEEILQYKYSGLLKYKDKHSICCN